MPRGEYTMTVNAGRLRSYGEAGEKLPYDRYEAVLELYQAQNAIQIAQSVGADRLAADSYRKALALFNEAQDMNLRKQDSHFVVSRAREAAQLAEDARAIAVKRSDEERTREARHEEHQAVKAERRAEQAEAAAAAAQQAAVAQEQANNAAAEQAAAEQQAAAAQANAVEQARAEAAAELRTRAQALAQPAAPPAIVGQPVPVVPPQPSGAQRQARAELLNRLNGVMATRDTPRGLVVTFSDTCFEANGNVQRPYAERLGLIASLLSSRPDLQVYVEGFTDDRGSQAEQRAVSERRAQEVRATLVANGLRSSSVQALGYGGSRPIVSNASAGGREQNRRVEIVISGPSVGGMALWDRTYPLNATR